MSKVTYNTYPRYVDIDRDGINQKVFTNYKEVRRNYE